jgi:hypothetical protein
MMLLLPVVPVDLQTQVMATMVLHRRAKGEQMMGILAIRVHLPVAVNHLLPGVRAGLWEIIATTLNSK